MVIVESHHWRGLGVCGTQRQTARGARAQSDAADKVLRNSLYACACVRLTGSYDNLCPMRQKCLGIRKGLQKLDTLGDRSHHPVHPLAGVVVGQHHLQAQLLSQHPETPHPPIPEAEPEIVPAKPPTDTGTPVSQLRKRLALIMPKEAKNKEESQHE